MNLPRSHLSVVDGDDARRDARLRDIVDDGILLMGAAGMLSALEFLKSHAVHPEVITRVLLNPAKRRGGTRPAA